MGYTMANSLATGASACENELAIALMGGGAKLRVKQTRFVQESRTYSGFRG